MVNERRWLISIFALYFFLAIGYSLLMPSWEAPDEPAHYHLAWHLERKGEYASYELNYEAQQPRFYYYLGSLVISTLNEINPKWTSYYLPRESKHNIRVPEPRFAWTDRNYRFLVGVHVLRWINILFGGIALWLNWKTFKFIASEKPTLCLTALAFAALTPQYLHIMSSVNNDAFGTLAGALLFYLMIRSVSASSNFLSLLTIILAVVLPLITKLTVLPVSAAVLIMMAWKWIFGSTQKKWLIAASLLLFACLIIFYVFFPEIIQTALGEMKWRLLSFRENAYTQKYMKFITDQILATYWGKVGWLAVGLPTWIIKSLTALGLIGMLLNVYALVKNRVMDQRSILWIAVWIIAVFCVLAVFRNGLTTRATQGRLLFPAIGALSLLMTAGWHELLPQKLQRHFPVFIVLMFLLCNMILWQTG
ncbi:MAG: hypothetical protein ACXW4E_05495, partial [Anaerolineales bacterium]